MPVKKYKHAIRWVPCESFAHSEKVFSAIEEMILPKEVLSARRAEIRAAEIERQEQIEHDQLVGIA